jgi:hypothetical protein
VLDGTTNYRLYWTLNENTIDLALHANSIGYLSFGIKEQALTDLVIGRMGTGCEEGCVTDFFVQNEKVKKDKSQDVQKVGAWKEGFGTPHLL